MTKKKPCSVCRVWFLPDPRVGTRQRTCSEACREAQRKRTQAKWRQRNPDYWAARRLSARAGQLDEGVGCKTARDGGDGVRDGPQLCGRSGRLRSGVAIRPPPSEMARVPWDMVQDAFGSQGVVLIAFLVRLAQRRVQAEMRPYPPNRTGYSPQHAALRRQDATDSHPGVVLDSS